MWLQGLWPEQVLLLVRWLLATLSALQTIVTQAKRPFVFIYTSSALAYSYFSPSVS